MQWVMDLVKLGIAIGLVNVWLLRRGKATPWRAGTARNMKEEFEVYGLPSWFMVAIGIVKVSLAILLVAGIWFPVLTRPAATALAALMLSAILMHIKAKDPIQRSLPAFTLLVLSIAVAWV